MKINKLFKTYKNQIDTREVKGKKYKAENKEVKREKSVDVQISKSTQELVEKIKKSQEIGFSEKVENIRKSILDGSYNVSSEEIGDKILQSIESQRDSEI